MASVFELKYDEKHGVAESTLMLATMSGGHFYNVVADENVDNGSVVVIDIDQYQEQDVFKAVKPTATDKVALVLTAPKIYEEYAKKCQEEAYFYNAAGERMRVYEIYETDRFALSKEAFDEDATPEKGKYVKVKAGSYKLTTDDSEPSGVGFIGKIYDVASNGNYKIFVIRNRAVEA